MSKTEMVVEASELGWKPGEWPTTFTYNGKSMIRGKMLLSKGNTFEGYKYHPVQGTMGATLNVFND